MRVDALAHALSEVLSPDNLGFDFYIGNQKLAYGAEWFIDQFPDGQLRLRVPEETDGMVCSVRNSIEFDLWCQANDTVVPKKIRVNYAYGARSDKHTKGVANVRDIFFGQVNSTSRLEIVCPHSVDQFRNWKPFEIGASVPWSEYCHVVWPDMSARGRVGSPKIDRMPVEVVFHKKRDPITGEILEHETWNERFDDAIVVDDLCDGGRTFTDIASMLSSPDLFVAHGVFSKGLMPLANAGYQRVFTTNSYDRRLQSGFVDGVQLIVEDVWKTAP